MAASEARGIPRVGAASIAHRGGRPARSWGAAGVRGGLSVTAIEDRFGRRIAVRSAAKRQRRPRPNGQLVAGPGDSPTCVRFLARSETAAAL
jgi:hypothetical protein